MDERTKMEYVFTLMFAIAFAFTLTFLWTFYSGLLNAIDGYGYVSYINMNKINEFWGEFIGLHIILVLLFVGVIWGWKYIFLSKEGKK